MNRFDVSQIFVFCAVVTTFWLCLGLVAAWWQRHRPARAHFVLFLALAGCLASPFAYCVARQWNLGVILADSTLSVSEAQAERPVARGQEPKTKDLQEVAAGTATVAQREHPEQDSQVEATISAKAQRGPWDRFIELVAGRRVPPHPDPPLQGEGAMQPLFGTWALGIWVAMSLALSVRVIVSLLSAARVLSRSHALSDPTIQAAVDLARRYLRIKTEANVRCFGGIESPAIWCWSGRPTLLIPAALLSASRPVQWESLVCHELAHWRRLDHVTSLVGELVLIAFPWHPLVWVARGYLRHLCELACDGWVIVAGHSRYHYAQNLLSLAVQPTSIAVLPAVSTKRGLHARIDQIVNSSVVTALIGRAWSWAASSIVLSMTLVIALLQAPSTMSQQPASKPDASSPESSRAEPRPSAAMTARRVETGDVRIYWGPGVSPNGRYFCGFNYYYDFYFGEIGTGKMTKVFEAEKENFYGVISVWSPDSQRILLSGSSRKVLLYEPATGHREVFFEGTPLYIFDWSSDRDSLVGIRNPGSDSNTLSLISFRTKAIRDLQALQQSSSSIKPTFSPDGKRLLYVTTTSARSVLHVLSLDGKLLLDYDEFLGRIESPLWTDDGKFIIFKCSQAGSIDLVALRYENDQIVGFPILIRPDAKNVELLDRVQNRQLTYKLEFEGGLYTLPMNPSAAKPVGKLRKMFQGGEPEHGWSPDGKKLARIVSPMLGEAHLVIVAADSGQLLNRVPLLNQEANFLRIGQAWSGENTVLVGSSAGAIGRGFYQVRIDSGEIEPVMPVSLSDLGPLGYFSVGAQNRVAIGGSAKGIHVVDLAQKRSILTLPKQTGTKERFVRQAISADGEWISFQQMGGRGKLWIASVKDGDSRVLFDFSKLDHTLNIHSWCPNGKFISAIAFPKGGDNELWMVPVDGGEPFQIPLPKELGEPWYPQWSPDGTQLAIHFFSGEDQYWVMQNYIPGASLQQGGR
ncbi:MAG: PD40 domain-containing protein [Verrucomicrobia bacterium]|nr:PD40 domain-containing protein [Verrucomicrobiota bacterium]